MKYYIFILSIFLLTACSFKSSTDQELDRIQHLIMEDPASAQKSLDSLSNYPINSSSLEARYILLTTYCNYRNYKSERNDSLINIAEQYYEADDGSWEKMMSKFLHAQILCDIGNPSDAMLKFKAAISEGEKRKDHFMLGQIYSNLYLLCRSAGDSESLTYAEKALNEYVIFGDDLYIIDGEMNVGTEYLYAGQYQRSHDVFAAILEKSIVASDTFNCIKSNRLLSQSEIKLNQFDSALYHLKRAKDEFQAEYNCLDYDILAEIYANMGIHDSAMYYLNLASENLIDELTERDHLLTTSIVLHKAGRIEEAYSYFESYNQKNEEQLCQRLSKSVMKEQRDYIEYLLEESQTEANHLSIIVIFVSAALVLSALVLYMHRQYHKKVTLHLEDNRRQLEDRIRVQSQKCMDIIQDIKMSKQAKKLFADVSNREAMTQEDWAELYALFSRKMPSFEQQLKKSGNLSETELQICILIKLGFTTGEIATLTAKAKNSISSAERRLWQKFFQSNGSTKDWQNYILDI